MPMEFDTPFDRWLRARDIRTSLFPFSRLGYRT